MAANHKLVIHVDASGSVEFRRNSGEPPVTMTLAEAKVLIDAAKSEIDAALGV